MIKVLIVEDDPMVADINKRYINSVDGFQVVEIVGDGTAAIGYCRKREVDLAILDIFMPRMDGMELLIEIRKRFPSIDVIFVTASREKKHIDDGLKLGAIDYLIKPFEYERMRFSLEKYRDRHQWMQGEEQTTQVELDRYITQSTDERKNLQKGLHEKTLHRVRTYLNASNHSEYTCEIIASDLQMSKVTVRRYLDYLEVVGEIKKEMVYGSVGRPSYKYFKI